MPTLAPLRDLLHHDDTVIFVGSGLSQWSGLPSWAGLIEELAQFLEKNGLDARLVRQEAADGDLLQAASYARAKLSAAQFGAFIRATCQTGSIVPHPIHHALMSLGPTCFITTNYDDLLEQSFRRCEVQPFEPHIVPNRNILEQANLVQASARGFIFKPHGDARDAESVILTREQYRQMMPGGAFSTVLETLQWLLASRPVLFVGFGLRDPDFVFVRDLLANAYRGGIREQYAIVADPVPDQIEWWRNSIGVHLVGYETRPRAGGGRDHNALLEMLEQLGETIDVPLATTSVSAALDISDPAIVLELARYGASVTTPQPPKHFDIVVKLHEKNNGGPFHEERPFDHWPVDRLLTNGPSRLILTGAPGAGKSFAVRHAVNVAGSRLQDACLQGLLTADTPIPVAIDLKGYDGNLTRLICERFPPNMSLEKLCATFPVKLFLDSYNEAPSEYRESGALDTDIDQLVDAFPTLGLIVGSRSADSLDRLDLPIFELSAMPVEETERLIARSGTDIPEQHRDEITQILCRPFYFRLVSQANIALEDVRSPAELYGAYIAYVVMRFERDFDPAIPLLEILREQGYQALSLGTEAFEIDQLARIVAHHAPTLQREEIGNVLNWLAAAEILVSLGGGRAAFVHQSVTEYLAACTLAVRLQRRETTASQMIANRRWDNAIFLALSMSDAHTARALMQEIASADLLFAIRGAHYVENRRDDVLEMLLETLLARPESIIGFGHDHAFKQLEFAPSHEQLLRDVAAGIEPLRAVAISALARIHGAQFKAELVSMLFDEPTAWATRGAMHALAKLIEPGDIAGLLDRAITLDPASLDKDGGETATRIDCLAIALLGAPEDLLEQELFARIATATRDQQRILAALYSEYEYHSPYRARIGRLAELLRAGLINSAFPLHMRTYRNDDIAAELLRQADDAFLDRLIALIEEGDQWSVKVLKMMCKQADSLALRVTGRARAASGAMAAVLDHCATGTAEPLFARLEAISPNADPGAELPALRAVDIHELNWTGREPLLVSLLQREELPLVRLLLGGAIPVKIGGVDGLPMGDPVPWLDWLVRLTEMDEPEDQDGKGGNPFFAQAQIAYLLARSTSTDRNARLLEILVGENPRHAWAVGSVVLPFVIDLTFDELDDHAIAILVNLLSTQPYRVWRPHIFAHIAPESFITDILLPLARSSDNAQLRQNIAHLADDAGKRLAVRFELPGLDMSHNQ